MKRWLLFIDHPDLLIRICIYFSKVLVHETNLFLLFFVKRHSEIRQYWFYLHVELIHLENVQQHLENTSYASIKSLWSPALVTRRLSQMEIEHCSPGPSSFYFPKEIQSCWCFKRPFLLDWRNLPVTMLMCACMCMMKTEFLFECCSLW